MALTLSHTRLVPVVCAAVLTCGCDIEAQIATTQGSFERALSVDGPVALTLTNGSGDATIVPGPAESVRIVGRIRAHESPFSALGAAERIRRLTADPPIVQSANDIRVGEIADTELGKNLSIDYEVIVPARTSVRIHVGSGDPHVGAVDGPVEVVTGSGDPTVGPIGRDAIVSTGSGDIELLGAGGDVTIKTGSGDLRASGVTGRLVANTASGDVEVEGRPIENWVVGTASGDVTLRLPADAAFTFDATTSSGSIDVTQPLDTSAARSRRHASGTVRGGGARVNVSTASGSIRLD